MQNNFFETLLSTPSNPPGVYLFTYQATVYFATAPTTFLSFGSFLFGPTGTTLGNTMTPIIQFAKLQTGTQTLSGSNVVVTQSSSVSLILTASSVISLAVAVNANAPAQAGGINTANVQSTYITATRIG